MAAWEGIHSCSRVAAVPTTCPWTNQCVCTVWSEHLHRLNSPGLLADCWLVFPSAFPDPVSFPILRAPKGCELWNAVSEHAADLVHV